MISDSPPSHNIDANATMLARSDGANAVWAAMRAAIIFAFTIAFILVGFGTNLGMAAASCAR